MSENIAPLYIIDENCILQYYIVPSRRKYKYYRIVGTLYKFVFHCFRFFQKVSKISINNMMNDICKIFPL